MAETLPQLIAQWNRTSSEAVRVQLCQYNGTSLIEVRIYWRNHEGEYRPSRKGISLGLKHLPALADALAQAEAKARAMGLLEA